MEAFFTTKKAGFGTGVGLSISCAIASAHGGSLKLLEGTRNTSFELLLPIPAQSEPMAILPKEVL
jgi:signal transduction histidine kinase